MSAVGRPHQARTMSGMPVNPRPIMDSAVVNADAQAVMAWWFHPDRWDDFRNRLERTGAREVSVTGSMEDDVTVVTISFVNPRGRRVHQRRERRLTSDGTAPRKGDRFVVETDEVMTKETQSGRGITRTCEGRTEFIPNADGSTEVVSVHRHALAGGTWAERLGNRRGDRTLQGRHFAELIESCRAATSF
jgi:hypothetical protein